MEKGRSETAGAALARWAVWSQRTGAPLVATLVLGSFVVGVYAFTHLGVNADNRRLLAEDLPFQRDARDFEARFPELSEALLVVIDGETPELARDAARRLADDLGRSPAFTDVFAPGSERFFEERGLLYRSADELEEFGDHLVRLQPLLTQLSAAPTLATLSRLLERGLEDVADSPVEWPVVLEGFRRATVEVYAEHPVALSWEDLVLEGSSFDARRRRVLVAEPKLDYDALLPAGPAIENLRDRAGALGLTDERGVRVRVTGYPALNDEEMRGLVVDVGVAGLFSFAAVGFLLAFALRWGRFVGATALTLGVGLVWTAGFAAWAVGQLNLVSVAFAVLFIGLGADFAIHLGLHLVEESRQTSSAVRAMRRAVASVGAALLLCTLTTAIGFWAFVPTDYRGVGELGLIAGFGMIAIFVLTLTLLPALLGESRPAADSSGAGSGTVENRVRTAVTGFAERRPGTVVSAFVLASLAALAAAPSARFDSNVVALRDPTTESVQAFEDLLEGESSPWTIEVLVRDGSQTRRRAAALAELPSVEQTRTLADYVPADQEEKLGILADLALIFDAPSEAGAMEEPDPATQIAALRSLSRVLGAASPLGGSSLGASADRLRQEIEQFLDHVDAAADPGAELARLEKVLLGRFPERMERLKRALAAERVTLEDVPASVVSRLRAEDGTERIQVFPSEDLTDPGALARFVAEVRSLEPRATGLPVSVVEFGRYTASSLREAFLGALGAIALLLFALWRRGADVFLALAPVTVAALLTVGTMVLLGRPFNFANVIVLPLLLGVGVDSGIHLVRRARLDANAALGGTATARAVFYSAVTTLVSFGSLALARHLGIASLGVLLVIGMLWTLATNLVMLPALLVLGGRRVR